MLKAVRQWFLWVFMGLTLVSSGAMASQPDKYGVYRDKSTWTIPDVKSRTNYVAGVYGKALGYEKFQVIYVGKGGRSPEGYKLNVVTPEVVNTPTGSLIKVTLRLGPYLYQDYTAYINRGNAEIDTRYNSRESIDWTINHLTRTRAEYEKTIGTKEEVGYVTVIIQAVENQLELVGTSQGDQLVRTGNVEKRQYTFGTHQAREAILTAKKNWDIVPE